MRTLFWPYSSSSENRKLLRVQREKFGYSVLEQWERLFLNIYLLLSKMQYSSDITSNIELYFRYYVKNSDSIEKIIGGYLLRKPNVRQKKCEF